jgi:thiamine biosynthesis lipoprotein
VPVGPVGALWARAGERNRRPRADELGEAVALVGQPVVLGPGWRASLPNPGMSVDLGGIAKGFALDTVARDLIAQGFTQGLLSFGESSIWALGAPADGPAWRLAVRADDGDILGTLDLRDQALSLSSSLGQSSEIEGRRYGHVVDPRSGEALTSRRRAIVVAGSATRAEILSTALLILDQREASALLAREDAEAFVTDEEGHHWQTRGWQAATAFEVSPRPRALGVRSGPSRGEEVARVRW